MSRHFSYRLRDAMLAAGFSSERTTSGVCLHDLANITGHSLQICRRYLRGEALPEPLKLYEIAQKLGVSAGWLLFGEEDLQMGRKNCLSLNQDLLLYLFSQIGDLYRNQYEQQDIACFLVELIRDLMQINAAEEQAKKIIDLALTSAKHFYQSSPKS